MESLPESRPAPAWRSLVLRRFQGSNVHVLSEHVFCPRAAILALESGEDEGDEEPWLGPRLDLFSLTTMSIASWRNCTGGVE